VEYKFSMSDLDEFGLLDIIHDRIVDRALDDWFGDSPQFRHPEFLPGINTFIDDDETFVVEVVGTNG
jgi:hypothetical protein